MYDLGHEAGRQTAYSTTTNPVRPTPITVSPTPSYFNALSNELSDALNVFLQPFSDGNAWDCQVFDIPQPTAMGDAKYQAKCVIDEWPYYGFSVLVKEPLTIFMTYSRAFEGGTAFFFDCVAYQPSGFDLDNCHEILAEDIARERIDWAHAKLEEAKYD